MEFKKIISQNIEQFGHHITLVNGNSMPRFAYTIGLRESLGFELIFAGCIYYSQKGVHEIINDVADVTAVTSAYSANGASCLSVLTDEYFFNY